MRTHVLALVGGLLMQGSALAADCKMSHAFAQPDDEGATTTAVWQDAPQTALLFGDALHVNTDGTRRSYSVSDFWGETTAINNLCNAMSDKCAGLDSSELRARRISTQDASAKGWRSDLLAATKIGSNIIPFKNGRPCPEVDGFLVSATALHKPNIDDVCDISNYADALTIPAIVLPGGSRRTPRRAFRRGTRMWETWPR